MARVGVGWQQEECGWSKEDFSKQETLEFSSLERGHQQRGRGWKEEQFVSWDPSSEPGWKETSGYDWRCLKRRRRDMERLLCDSLSNPKKLGEKIVYTGQFCRVVETDKKGKSWVEVARRPFGDSHSSLAPRAFLSLSGSVPWMADFYIPQAPCSLASGWVWSVEEPVGRVEWRLSWLTSYGLCVGSDCIPLLMATGRALFLKSLLSLCVLKTHTLFSSGLEAVMVSNCCSSVGPLSSLEPLALPHSVNSLSLHWFHLNPFECTYQDPEWMVSLVYWDRHVGGYTILSKARPDPCHICFPIHRGSQILIK